MSRSSAAETVLGSEVVVEGDPIRAVRNGESSSAVKQDEKKEAIWEITKKKGLEVKIPCKAGIRTWFYFNWSHTTEAVSS